MQAILIGTTETGIKTYRLENDCGMTAEIISYGARIKNLFVPDRNGNFIDVVAGFDDPEQFRNDYGTYFNAAVGRVCNRIEGGRFCLDGKEYTLFKNDGNNHLHGGKSGFSDKLWDAEIQDGASVKFCYLSKDGEEGYPANLKVEVTYTLTDDNALEIAYRAESDGDTLCSLTNHAYFNLDGDFDTALNHIIHINADAMTAVDDELIPHGEIMRVRGTAFDFCTPKKLGKDINADEKLLKTARGGYDFNYVLNARADGEKAAFAYSEKSGIEMSVYTDRPCLQFYTGNFLDGINGKKTYGYQSAFCMETQGYPNACNVKSFDSILLKKGEIYQTSTTYKFDIK